MSNIEKKLQTIKEIQQDIGAKQAMLNDLMKDIAVTELGFPENAPSFDLVDLMTKAYELGKKQ